MAQLNRAAKTYHGQARENSDEDRQEQKKAFFLKNQTQKWVRPRTVIGTSLEACFPVFERWLPHCR